ncbi:hypothetical protein CAEBREN_19288 [Caenorhabditis brenneri]|uniref:Uncharacterized protein n=1 Tax=Caenorhabditis brenneri TaxID=135651 RepID=G0PG54_CAEBE|nr:hypothetical protein CAEBREN_19288 [Caenorhabditis brenneri]
MDLKSILEQLEEEKRCHYETKMKLQRCEDRLQTQKDYQTLYEEKLRTIRELEESLAVRNTRISQLNRMKTEDSTTILRLSDRINHLEIELNIQENLKSKVELRDSQIEKLFKALKDMKQSLKEANGYIEELKSTRFSLEMRIHAMEQKQKGVQVQPVVKRIQMSLDESSDDDEEEEEEETDEEMLRKIFEAEPPRPTGPIVRVQPNPIIPVVRDMPIDSPSRMMDSTFDADVARLEISSDSSETSYSSGEDALQRLLNERGVVKPILKKRNVLLAIGIEEQENNGSGKRVRFSL